jgi:hypothetical protein
MNLSSSTRLLFDNQKEPIVEIQFKNNYANQLSETQKEFLKAIKAIQQDNPPKKSTPTQVSDD